MNQIPSKTKPNRLWKNQRSLMSGSKKVAEEEEEKKEMMMEKLHHLNLKKMK